MSCLLCCIEPTFQAETSAHFDAKVFNCAAIVHILPLDNPATSGEYSDTIVIPWIERQLQGYSTIDIVWDIYRPDSLKTTTREKLGNGTRRKMSRDAKLPMYFAGFLSDVTNKE